jgi:radical SAM superfamily enzyme YgiQ (UPF0313 family)
VAAALLTHGHDVAILDTAMSSENEIHDFLNSKIDVLGITSASFSINKALAFAKDAKARNSALKVILGGPSSTTSREEILKHPEIDFGIYGEGEITMSD